MAEVTVVGAGVVGLSVAWMLAEAGAAVTVVDSGPPGRGASGYAHGEIIPPSSDLQSLWRQSLAVYQRLAQHGDFGWDGQPIGTVILAHHHETGLLIARNRAYNAHGVETQLVDAGQLRGMEPSIAPAGGGALVLAEGRRVNPRQTVAALAGSARSVGVELNCDITVVGLRRAAGRWQLLFADGRRTQARKVVLATGLHTSQLAQGVGCRIPLVGVRGRILVTEPLPQTLSRIVSSVAAGPAALAATRTTLGDLAAGAPAIVAALMHQRRDGRFAIGASWSPALGPEDKYSPSRIAQAAVRRLPALADAAAEDSWSGVRPYAVDGRPVIDEIEEDLYACCGHGGEGFILGPGSAQLMAQIVLDRDGTHAAAASFSADRFT
nr:FAD-dependent oxidoreductase [Streptomyces chartreusis]